MIQVLADKFSDKQLLILWVGMVDAFYLKKFIIYKRIKDSKLKELRQILSIDLKDPCIKQLHH